MTISVSTTAPASHDVSRAIARSHETPTESSSTRARPTRRPRPCCPCSPTCPPAADRDRVRARLIELYIPLAEYLARRFRNRGEQFDDLVQVANLGLIKSVDGYDPTRGAAFTSYAIPMIVGELKRHFRDKGWDVRVPRRLQELRLEISKVSGDLAQDLGRSPTVADLADAASA